MRPVGGRVAGIPVATGGRPIIVVYIFKPLPWSIDQTHCHMHHGRDALRRQMSHLLIVSVVFDEHRMCTSGFLSLVEHEPG